MVCIKTIKELSFPFIRLSLCQPKWSILLDPGLIPTGSFSVSDYSVQEVILSISTPTWMGC